MLACIMLVLVSVQTENYNASMYCVCFGTVQTEDYSDSMYCV